MLAKKNCNLLSKTSVVLLVLILTPNLMAFDWGLKAGLSVSDQTYDYSITGIDLNRLSETGIAAGVFINLNFSPLTSVRFGADYIQKGSAIELYSYDQGAIVIGTIRIEDRLDYLSLNLLATPSLIKGAPISPYLVIGPRVDILLSSETYLATLTTEEMKSGIFGASVGAGVKFSIGSASSLFVEGVYQPDFSDSFEIQTLTIKNNSFLISAGLMF